MVTVGARTAQDMQLSQVRDVDHLLSMFVFDEAAFADFVRDAHPTTDDHTVLDFSMPRYLGSGFGLGQFNVNVKTTDVNPFLLAFERRAEYMKQHRSILPLLVNLGPDTPQEIAARIDQRRELPFTKRYFTEDQWKRMRKDGTFPPLPAN